MNALRRLRHGARRFRQIAGAFIRMDYIEEISYPLGLVMKGAQAFSGVIIWAFVARLTGTSGPSVGGDYYTFVVIGLVAMQVLHGGLNGFSAQIGDMMQRGRLEMVLVEPIRWRLLPFGLGQWVLIRQVAVAGVMVAASLLFGARYSLDGLLVTVVVLILGIAATFTIGVLSASVKVLSKRSDPVLAIYQIAALVLSGVFYPVEVLPSALRSLSWLVPHTYVIAALRKTLMPQGDLLPGMSGGEAMLLLLAFCAIAYPISLWLFGRSLDYGREMGVLSGY